MQSEFLSWISEKTEIHIPDILCFDTSLFAFFWSHYKEAYFAARIHDAKLLSASDLLRVVSILLCEKVTSAVLEEHWFFRDFKSFLRQTPIKVSLIREWIMRYWFAFYLDNKVAFESQHPEFCNR
jgi:hypothetical protein